MTVKKLFFYVSRLKKGIFQGFEGLKKVFSEFFVAETIFPIVFYIIESMILSVYKKNWSCLYVMA